MWIDLRFGSAFYRYGLLGAPLDTFLDSSPVVVAGLLIEHIEEVVVSYLEKVGRNLHADGVAFAEIEIDHDLHLHHLSDWGRGADIMAHAEGRRGTTMFHRSRMAWSTGAGKWSGWCRSRTSRAYS